MGTYINLKARTKSLGIMVKKFTKTKKRHLEFVVGFIIFCLIIILLKKRRVSWELVTFLINI